MQAKPLTPKPHMLTVKSENLTDFSESTYAIKLLLFFFFFFFWWSHIHNNYHQLKDNWLQKCKFCHYFLTLMFSVNRSTKLVWISCSQLTQFSSSVQCLWFMNHVQQLTAPWRARWSVNNFNFGMFLTQSSHKTWKTWNTAHESYGLLLWCY